MTGILELSSAVVVQSVGECGSEQAENAFKCSACSACPEDQLKPFKFLKI